MKQQPQPRPNKVDLQLCFTVKLDQHQADILKRVLQSQQARRWLRSLIEAALERCVSWSVGSDFFRCEVQGGKLRTLKPLDRV